MQKAKEMTLTYARTGTSGFVTSDLNAPSPPSKTHHVPHVLCSEGGQLQLQLAQVLEALQEVLEKCSGFIHQQKSKAIW